MLISLHEGGSQQSLGTATLGVKGDTCVESYSLWIPYVSHHVSHLPGAHWVPTQLLNGPSTSRTKAMELECFARCQYLSQTLCLAASKGASVLHFAPLASNGL